MLLINYFDFKKIKFLLINNIINKLFVIILKPIFNI